MPNNNKQENLLALKERVIEIVRGAVMMIRSMDFTVTEKSKSIDIVTSNDLASQRYLIEKLSNLIPDSGFYCEEEGVCERDKEYVWIIDPIDGTANYSRGIGECAISVALTRNGNIILGVVCSIYTDDVYSAVLGCGAFLNGKPISVSQNPFENSILCTAMSLYKKEHAKVCADIIFEAYMKCNDVRRFGSCAIELCYLAAGKCDLYFEIRVFPWDYAAGYLILQEAGGIIKGLSDKNLNLNGPSIVIAANTQENYEMLSKIVNKHINITPYED